MTSLTSWRAACDISARSFGLPTNYERPIISPRIGGSAERGSAEMSGFLESASSANINVIKTRIGSLKLTSLSFCRLSGYEFSSF